MVDQSPTGSEPDALEYFSGGVPTAEYFRLKLDDLRKMSRSDPEAGVNTLNSLQELCFIGALAYFEAFCKDHFAVILNLEPDLASNLKDAGYDTLVDANYVSLYRDDCERRVGFILSSMYDFGTAKKINALFRALLDITPFSKDERKKFDALLRDRHLLVHHGGVYTLSYLEQQNELVDRRRTDAFFHSRVIVKQELLDALDFIEDVARKLVRGSHRAFVDHLENRGIAYTGERKRALSYMSQWLDKSS